MPTFAVVTDTNPEWSNSVEGNLATAMMDLYLPKDGPNSEYARAIDIPEYRGLAFHARLPVFHVGEILILDESGREVGYPGRKPTKWYIETESFDDLADAIERAQAAQDEWLQSFGKGTS